MHFQEQSKSLKYSNYQQRASLTKQQVQENVQLWIYQMCVILTLNKEPICFPLLCSQKKG